MERRLVVRSLAQAHAAESALHAAALKKLNARRQGKERLNKLDPLRERRKYGSNSMGSFCVGVFLLASTRNTPGLNRGNGLWEVYTTGVKGGPGLFPLVRINQGHLQLDELWRMTGNPNRMPGMPKPNSFPSFNLGHAPRTWPNLLFMSL